MTGPPVSLGPRRGTEPTWLTIARAELGVAEIPGPATNDRIAAYLETVGISDGDETPWCSAFVQWCLEQAGYMGTRQPNARSWLAIGDHISKFDARPGDIVILWRGSPAGWQGHVGFLLSINGSTVTLLGGNQNNAVSIADYPVARILGIRRPA